MSEEAQSRGRKLARRFVQYLANNGVLSDQLTESLKVADLDSVHDVTRMVLVDPTVDPELFANIIARMTGVPRIKLQSLPPVRPEVFAILPEQIVRENGLFTLGFLSPDVVAVGVINPLEHEMLALTSFFAGARVRPLVLSATDVAAEYERRFRRSWVVPWEDLADRALRLSTSRSKLEFSSMSATPISRSGGELPPAAEPWDEPTGNRIGKDAIEKLNHSMGSEVSTLRLAQVARHRTELGVSRRMTPIYATEHSDDAFDFSGATSRQNDVKYAFGGPHEEVEPLDLSESERNKTSSELLGYTGALTTLLDRTRERDAAATQLFQLICERLETSPEGHLRIGACLEDLLLIYTTVLVARLSTTGLTVVDVKSTLRNVRTEIGRTFSVNRDSIWDLALDDYVSYRGKLSGDDPLSEHLLRLGEREVWVVPLRCQQRVVGVMAMTCDSHSRMRLPIVKQGIDAFDALGDALAIDVTRALLGESSP